MKVLFTLTILFIICLANAQDWCHPGSTWTYGFDDGGDQGYLAISYEKDTVVDNLPCHKLTSIGQESFCYDCPTSAVFNGPSFYTFSRNDSVFILRKGGFIPNYFFNVAAGDTIDYINYYSQYTDSSGADGCPSDTLREVVDSTGIDTINNYALRYYIAHGINENEHPISEKIIERLGTIDNYFELSYACTTATDGGGYYFRCYQDDSFPLYQLDPQRPCDFVTSIQTQPASINSIYPNPATDYVVVDYGFTDWSKDEVLLQISNALGQMVYSQQLPTPIAIGGGFQKIDISNFASGMYTVFIKRNGGVVASGKVVKE